MSNKNVINLPSLIIKVATGAGVDPATSRRFIHDLFVIVEEKLAAGESVSVPGIGEFAPGMGPDHAVLFRPNAQLSAIANEPFSAFTPVELYDGAERAISGETIKEAKEEFGEKTEILPIPVATEVASTVSEDEPEKPVEEVVVETTEKEPVKEPEAYAAERAEEEAVAVESVVVEPVTAEKETESETVEEEKTEPVVEQKAEPEAVVEKAEPVTEQKAETKAIEEKIERKAEPVVEQKAEPVAVQKVEPAVVEQPAAQEETRTPVSTFIPPKVNVAAPVEMPAPQVIVHKPSRGIWLVLGIMIGLVIGLIGGYFAGKSMGRVEGRIIEGGLAFEDVDTDEDIFSQSVANTEEVEKVAEEAEKVAETATAEAQTAPAPAPAAQVEEESAPEPVYDYVTKNLAALAQKHYGNKNYWVFIYKANPNLGNPNLIAPQTRLRIPAYEEFSGATKAETNAKAQRIYNELAKKYKF